MDAAPVTPRGSGLGIRVFISSTFRDMHAERDVLNREVFPELRRRCQVRGAEFVGFDLRWGVTEDEIQRDGTLAICLREIAQCRPFFLCFLGERFGSVYPPDEVPIDRWDAAQRDAAVGALVAQCYRRDDTVTPPVYRLRREPGRSLSEEDATTLERYWEARGLAGAGDSLTAHEIVRGVLEAKAPPSHAFCYLRAQGLTADPAFPAALVPVFVETDPVRQQKLDTLKSRARGATDRLTVRDYDAQYAGLTIDPTFVPPELLPADRTVLADGVVKPADWPNLSPALRAALEQHGTVALTRHDRDALAAQVIADLWRGIEPELARPVTRDAHQRERAYHEQFVTRHTALFQGREEELERVGAYLARRDDSEILVVTGEPGTGKSAFMAACVQQARSYHPKTLVIPHFIGAAPESAALSATLRSLCEMLRGETDLPDAVAEDPDKLRVQLRIFLEQAGGRRPIILFLDALNQLDSANRSHDLDWLPRWAPPGTRIVVSTLAGDCLEQLTRHVPDDHIVTIPPLPEDERRILITTVLARRRKQLTPAQLTTLLDTRTRPDAALPLYTLVALEELCLFGEYGALEGRLAKLPPTLPELFAQVLARLEQDHTRATVEAVCAWLAVARSGLLESEVLDLLGKGVTFPRIRWARLYRALESYLKPIEEDAEPDDRGLIDFYHDQLRFAAYQRYLRMPSPDVDVTDLYREAHRQLAEYFRSAAYDSLLGRWQRDRVRGLSELPFHQTRGESWEDLFRTLTDFDFLAAKCAHVAVNPGSGENARITYDGVYALQGDFRRALESVPARLTRSMESAVVRSGGVTSDERRVLEAFERALDRESYILRGQPSLLWQQLYNRLRWEPTLVSSRLTSELARRTEPGTAPWFRATAPSWESRALLRTLVGHTKPVRACSFSPNGQLIVSASADSISGIATERAHHLRLWDVITGRQCATLKGHQGHVNACTFSPDGQLVLSASSDKTLRLWDVATSAERVTLTGHDGPINDCAFSPDGRLAASADGWDGTLRLWDVETGRERAVLRRHQGEVNACSFSPDGQLLVSAGVDWTLKLWEVATGLERATLAGHRSSVVACGFSPDGKLVVSACWDNTLNLKLWDVMTGKEYTAFRGHAKYVSACAFSPDGHLVVSASWDRTLKLWDVATGGEHATLSGHGDLVNTCAFSPDGKLVVSASHDNTLKIWDVSTGVERATLAGHVNNVRACAFSPDGRLVVSASEDQTLKLWGVTADREHATLAGHGRPVKVCAFSPDGQLVVSAGGDTLKLWDSTTGRERATLAGHRLGVSACAFSSDGRLIASAYQDGMKMWDVATGRELTTLGGHGNYLHSGLKACAFSLDGRLVAASSYQHSLTLWEVATGRERATIRTYGAASSCAFSPDSQLVATTSGTTLVLYETATGREYFLHDQGARPSMCVFSPDGRLVVAASSDDFSDDFLKLWEVRTGRERATLSGHRAGVNSCAFSPDSRLVLSASNDHTLKLWDAETGHERATLAGHTGAVRHCIFTWDGNSIMSLAADETVRLWDAASGFERAVLPLAGLTAFAIHPSGRVSCGSEFGAIWVGEIVGVSRGAFNVEDPPTSKRPWWRLWRGQ